MPSKIWQDWWPKRRADIAALATAALFFVAFFHNVLFGHRFVIAGDALYYSYPLRTLAWQMIRNGEFPLWTPQVLSGYPLLAMSQVAIGYPLTWIYFFVHGPWAEQVYVLAPFFLTPMFMYAYVRELGLSRLAGIFAGLAFGYGGMMCSFIANSGLLTNSLMWMPLVLLFIDRAQRRSFPHCLSWATVAYAMSVLAGHGQSYVYMGVLAIGYALFLSAMSAITALISSKSQQIAPQSGRAWREWLRWQHWQPLLVALGAVLLSAGIAAFQLLETLRAARRSIRSELSYNTFGEGSFSLREALLSIGAPLYHYVDTSGYVAPLALVCVLIAIIWAARGRIRDARVWFWLAVAVIAFLMMLGTSTPLYRLVYQVPVLNQFRVPSRHSFEWTLALCVLSAFGWDAVESFMKAKRHPSLNKSQAIIIVALFVLIVCVAAMWWRAANVSPPPNASIYTGLRERNYWLWKLGFTAILFGLACLCFRYSERRGRTVLLTAVIMLGLFVEPSATIACWWGERLSLDSARLQLTSPTTRYLQQFAPEQNRVYSRVGLFAEEFNSHPRLEAPNLPALYGLQNVAGMEPLILNRYSRALGSVGPDSVTPRLGFPANNESIFGSHSHVLDLLNATHVLSFTNLKPFEDELTLKNDIGFAASDLDVNLPPLATAKLQGFGADTDLVAIVTSLSNSVLLEQDAAVARVRMHTSGGNVIEHDLYAGRDTAEWAHERPDVKATIKHKLAPIFDGRPGDPANTFTSYRYWTSFKLEPRQHVELIEITNLERSASLAVWKVTLHDSAMAHSAPLTLAPARATLDGSRWQIADEVAGVFVLNNKRALPRAWLVTEAEAVDDEEALRRIRGESTREFDPQRTALLEVKPDSMPVVAKQDGPLKPVRMTNYSATSMSMETEAATPTVLVVSEIFYPGWQATVDGHQAEILLTDYFLRGLALPAGKHTIEMRYRATAARNGAIISGLALCGLLALLTSVYLKRSGREH